MLKLTIPGNEYWDDVNECFKYDEETTIFLEHSLISVSKWEEKWHIPFLGDKYEKTAEQIEDYIKCMTITKNVDPSVYSRMTEKQYKEIKEYIENPMTATWFSDKKKKNNSREVITAEVIYYWMIESGIPPEYSKWHLNKLLTLVRVINEERADPEKKSKKEIAKSHASINAARRKAAAMKKK